MEPVIILGHKNPDNDSIMSAVVLASLMNRVDEKNEYIAGTLGELPGESTKLIEEHGFPTPRFIERIEEPAEGADAQRIILVDHNERSQAVDGLEHADILQIFDHHRLADIQTANPILFLCMPVGSTATIIATRFDHYDAEMTDAEAACLLAAMMTDTVMLKSPTTTEVDKRIAAQLGDKIGVDPREYGAQVFKSRGAGGFTVDDMVTRDTKRFEIGGRAVYIGQYETVDSSTVEDKVEDLRVAMGEYLIENKGDTFVLLVTDIIEEGSLVFVAGEDDLVGPALGIELDPAGTWMPGVLSRKKQVAAPLIAAGE